VLVRSGGELDEPSPDDSLTVTLTLAEAMPLATTSSELGPVSIPEGTSKLVETMALPVATGHGAMVVGSGIKNVAGRLICDPHQRIVRRRLFLVSKCIRLRQAVELRAGDGVCGTTRQAGRKRSDGRSPCGRRLPRGRVELNGKAATITSPVGSTSKLLPVRTCALGVNV